MAWEERSKTGYVRNINLFRKGKLPSNRRYYFTVIITDNQTGDATDTDETYSLPEEVDNVVGQLASDVIHAGIISTLRDALCNGNQVTVKGEKFKPDGYPDAVIRDYMRSLPYPLITSAEIVR